MSSFQALAVEEFESVLNKTGLSYILDSCTIKGEGIDLFSLQCTEQLLKHFLSIVQTHSRP